MPVNPLCVADSVSNCFLRHINNKLFDGDATMCVKNVGFSSRWSDHPVVEKMR